MPTSILEEVNDLLDIAEAQGCDRLPEYALRFVRPIVAAAGRSIVPVLECPSCGSACVAQVLGDNGGISYVCTACGRSWS